MKIYNIKVKLGIENNFFLATGTQRFAIKTLV